jgi:hypothetical protein
MQEQISGKSHNGFHDLMQIVHTDSWQTQGVILEQIENDVLTPEHPQWNDFIVKLKGKKDCNHTFDSTAIIVAIQFPEIDLFSTISYLKKCGANCDCTISCGQKSKNSVNS